MCIHNAQAHTSNTYYEQSTIHYVLCLLQLLRSALYHFVKVKMSQIVSSNSFHYFKNQFFQEEVPISEKMKCYDYSQNINIWKSVKKIHFTTEKVSTLPIKLKRTFWKVFFSRAPADLMKRNLWTVQLRTQFPEISHSSLISWVQVVWTGSKD